MKTRILQRAAMLLLCAAAGLCLCLSAHATAAQQQETVVRVGYAELQGFLYQKNGRDTGLAYDLMQEIGAYNNWTFEFVPCSYSEIAQYFDEDRIDLYIPYQKTPERAEQFEYSDEALCTNRASLLTVPESPLYYNDFAALDGCVIGAPAETRNGQLFLEYLAGQGCTVTVDSGYKNQQELIAAAQAGTIDCFVSASNRSLSECKIIAVLPQTYSYVLAPKGNRTYLSGVDDALRKIDVEMPNLLEKLNEKYQTADENSYPALSRDEEEYIERKGTVTVLVSGEECDANGQLAGSAKVLFDNISRLTGLAFEPVICAKSTDAMSMIREGGADVIYMFNRDFEWARLHNVWLTRSYAEFYDKVVTRAGQSDLQTVSVVKDSFIAHRLAAENKYQMVEYTSVKACLDAVKNGDVDGTFCNSPIGNYYSTFPKYNTLSFLTAYDADSAYCMGVSRQSEQILVDVLNKAILCIPANMLNSTYEVQMNSRPVALSDVLYQNPIGSAVLIATAAVMLLTLVFGMFYFQRIRRKNRQLAVANSAKTDFMARMSHDMRTPMNGILGLTQLTKDETDLAVIRTNLDQIELSGKFLLDLINDTLDMNKMESGNLALHPKPINSEKVFGNVIANAQIMAREKGVKLTLSIPSIAHGKWVPVVADASRLEQVLINIISNAIKFTPKGGEVELHMETISVGNGVVRDKYIIRDTGIGMSKEFLPRLFEPFSQENRNVNVKDQGTGLGMPIVKQLVELMNGEILVKSELNKGTEITLLMQYPICDEKLVDETAPQPGDDSVLQGKHVLLCEDHPINARIAVKLLEKKGMLVDVAENGKIGVEKFSASEIGGYSVLLVDIRMPVMDGLEAARTIRALGRADAATVPIIAMTANAFEEDVQNCRDAGMNDHLAKPVDAEKLYDTLARYIGR